MRAFRWQFAALLTCFLLAGWCPAQEPPGRLIVLESQESEGEEAEPDEIETDRDSFTPATTTAGFRRMIFESAWSFIDNRAVPDTNSLPELVTRFGISNWLELRLGWNWEAGGAANSISGGGSDPEVPTENRVERDSQLFYGFKVALWCQND